MNDNQGVTPKHLRDLGNLPTPPKGQPYCLNCGSADHKLCEVTGEGTWSMGGQPSVDIDDEFLNKFVYGFACGTCDTGGTDGGQETCKNCGGSGIVNWQTTELKAALLAHALSLKPEHIDNWKDVDPKNIGERTPSSGNLGLYRKAFNDCLDLWEQSLRASYK